ncbi:unnamed protein product [Fusarium langsethiae]|nr:unnamed protein product [Fusarium langsethiae]
MAKGKNKAFDTDDQFRLSIQDLHDPNKVLKSPRNVAKAEEGLGYYHNVLSSPNLMPSGAQELRRYIMTEDWVSHIGKTKSQTRIYKHLTGNGRATLNLHFGGWLVANVLFNPLPDKIRNAMSFWWHEDFPPPDVTEPFFPSKNVTESKQAKKIKGQTSEGFMAAFRGNERATKTLASTSPSTQRSATTSYSSVVRGTAIPPFTGAPGLSGNGDDRGVSGSSRPTNTSSGRAIGQPSIRDAGTQTDHWVPALSRYHPEAMLVSPPTRPPPFFWQSSFLSSSRHAHDRKRKSQGSPPEGPFAKKPSITARRPHLQILLEGLLASTVGKLDRSSSAASFWVIHYEPPRLTDCYSERLMILKTVIVSPKLSLI